MAASSSRVAVQPVGFAGELMTIALLRGVTAAAIISMSSVQPALPKRIGTSTLLAPLTPSAAAKFGQAGVGMMTSSPSPATIRLAICTACMPEPVTKKRSAS